jgi:hypothetical protein
MRATVAPFRLPEKGAAVHAGWTMNTADGEVSLPDELDHWDYQTRLELHAGISVNRELFLTSAGLGPKSQLEVVIVARSNSTRIRRCVSRMGLPDQPSYDLVIPVHLPGWDLGGVLDLTTMIVATNPDPLNDLSARRDGSILWHVRHRTHLEGRGARFPTDATDFTVTRPASANAGWYLTIDSSDPEVSFMASVRLTLNSALPIIQRVLAGEDSPETRRMRSVISWDVARQLVLFALHWDQLPEEAEPDDDASLGGVLSLLLVRFWPTDTPPILRRRLEDEPSAIEAKIQHSTRTFCA